MKRSGKLWGIVWKVVLVCVLMYPVVVVIGVMYGNPYSNFVVGKAVPKHLESLGYDVVDDIEGMYVFTPKLVYDRGNLGSVMYVRFSDVPDVEYEYGVSMFGNEVVQYCNRNYYERLEEYDNGVVSEHLEARCYDWHEGVMRDRGDFESK